MTRPFSSGKLRLQTSSTERDCALYSPSIKIGQCCLVDGRDDVHRHQFRLVLEGSDLVRHAKNAQAAAGAEFQNALRPAAADDFAQKKPPLEIRRIVAPGFFSQTGQPPNLENAGFFCAVIENHAARRRE